MYQNHSKKQTIETSYILLWWYGCHYTDRGFQWREYGVPFIHLAIVEALLPRVQPSTIVRNYTKLVGGISCYSDWMAMGNDDRFSRVSPLGLGMEACGAVNGTLSTILSGESLIASRAKKIKGVSRQSASMVALLHGCPSLPLNLSLKRIASRVAPNNSEGWLREVIKEARNMASSTGHAPAYEVVNAISDIAERFCNNKTPRCSDCPLRLTCQSSDHIMSLNLETNVTASHYYNVETMEIEVVNLDATTWMTSRLKLDIGSTIPARSSYEIKKAMEENLEKDYMGHYDLKGMSVAAFGKRIVNIIMGDKVWCRIQFSGRSRTVWKG